MLIAALFVQEGGAYYGLPEERAATPIPFRDLLISIARGARHE